MNSAKRRQSLVDGLAGNNGTRPQLYCAPGRVNIIGEHTDYTEGFVLPTTTAAHTWVAASRRTDRKINVRSLNLNQQHTFNLDDLECSTAPEWFDYVKGVAALLEEQGVALPGADILIESEIPIGGGLSSSAALEVAVAVALLDLADANMPTRQVAQLCQRAEVVYAGVKCGIMDQFAIASCKRDHAMLLDCRNLATKFVRLPEDVGLLLTDSGVKHALPDGDYNRRTEECAAATELVAKKIVGLRTLRDLDLQGLESSRNTLGDTLHRRCRHIVSENRRVLHAYDALKSTDIGRLGELISASHASLRDDFEVSCDQVDSLVEIADSCDGVLGSRMIGAGFGGCVLSVIERNRTVQTMLEIGSRQEAATGKAPWMHVVTATDPAKKVGLA